MRLTEEQFTALQPYEEHFKTMVRSKWARHPGMSALDLIHSIYCQVTGVTTKFNNGCSHCIMQLLSDMGAIYLADLEERERTRVAVKESLTTDAVKVEVKTKRKYTRKPKA